jgi:hypothetical protein
VLGVHAQAHIDEVKRSHKDEVRASHDVLFLEPHPHRQFTLKKLISLNTELDSIERQMSTCLWCRMYSTITRADTPTLPPTRTSTPARASPTLPPKTAIVVDGACVQCAQCVTSRLKVYVCNSCTTYVSYHDNECSAQHDTVCYITTHVI